MTEGTNRGNRPGEKKRGFFSRFGKDESEQTASEQGSVADQTGSTEQQSGEISPPENRQPDVETSESPLLVEKQPADSADVSRFARLRRAFGRQSESTTDHQVFSERPLATNPSADIKTNVSAPVDLTETSSGDSTAPTEEATRLDSSGSQAAMPEQFTVKQPETLEEVLAEEPTVEQIKEPSAAQVDEPSAGQVKEPSAERVKEPSAGQIKESSTEQVKAPSAEQIKDPSAKWVNDPSAESVEAVEPTDKTQQQQKTQTEFATGSAQNPRVENTEEIPIGTTPGRETDGENVAQDDASGQDLPQRSTLEEITPQEKVEKPQRFGLIKRALAKTGKGLGRVFLGKKQIDDELLEELETQLLSADLGVEVTSEIIAALVDRVKRKELDDVDALQAALKQLLVEILKPCEVALDVNVGSPFVLLTVGVNGVGKTTTIGKLAKLFLAQKKSVMLAAGDTFRAAAVEQLQIWGDRNQVPVVAQHTGADSASVIFDAVESARARRSDLLIADTAGRLHTKSNLMDELKKIKRVLGKLDESAPHEVLLVLDAGTGQNAVNQLKQFHEAVGVTGIVLTKLDGTAKGGVIFALCRKFGLPVRYIGVGEGVEDLQPFNADDFVTALLTSGAGTLSRTIPGTFQE